MIACFGNIDFSHIVGNRMLHLTSLILLLLGFNSTETKIRTPDGKVWKEEEFHNLSREIYRDLSRQFAGKHRTQTFSSHCYHILFVKCSAMIRVLHINKKKCIYVLT